MSSMHRKRRHIITLLMLIIAAPAMVAQNVTFRASAPSAVETGEQFRLSFVLNAVPSSFQGPGIEDFYVLSGPNRSSSTSVQIINGKRSRSVTTTYTYFLQATREGSFRVGPATAIVDNKQYQSNSLNIEVIRGSAGSPQQPQQQPQKQDQSASSGSNSKSGEIFVRILTDKNKVYQGEHLVATLKLYTRLDVTSLGNRDFPDFNGFWTQEIPQPSQISLQRENVNGVLYNTGVLRKVLLFPQRTGKITIEPFELEAIIRQRVNRRTGSVFDDFFSSYTNVSKPLVSAPVTITVMELPGGKPASFTGAVGTFDIAATIDKEQAQTNDAITLTYRISGTGNVKLADAPVINFPPDFETYDPKVTTNIKNDINGQSGSKTFEYLLIPRHAGKFRLPRIEFSYFDPSEKRYKSLSSPEFNLTISKGDGDEEISVVQGLSKEEYQLLGEDILFIKPLPFRLYRAGKYLYGSVGFYLVYLVALILFITVVVLRRRHIRRMQNTELVKNKKANRMAGRKLRQAQVHLRKEEQEDFYESVLKALIGYLGDKLSIPRSELSRERALELLGRYGVDEGLKEDLMSLLDACEMARYSPAASESGMQDVYAEAVKVLSTLEKNLKR